MCIFVRKKYDTNAELLSDHSMGGKRAYCFELDFDLHYISCIILSYLQTFSVCLVVFMFFVNDMIYFQNILWYVQFK